MRTLKLHQHYDLLEPEERFRLLLAAAGRHDDQEHERLMRSAGRVAFRMPDHAPWAHAFHEIATLTMMELVEDAAAYDEAFHHAIKMIDDTDDGDELSDEECEPGDEEPSPDVKPANPPWVRAMGVVYAAGFVLKTKIDGWALFCERLNIPPLLLWEALPGYERLQETLEMARERSFDIDGIREWLNRVRPPGAPPSEGPKLSVDGVADATETMFADRVEFWGGE